jgi:hypothetical protein
VKILSGYIDQTASTCSCFAKDDTGVPGQIDYGVLGSPSQLIISETLDFHD